MASSPDLSVCWLTPDSTEPPVFVQVPLNVIFPACHAMEIVGNSAVNISRYM